VHIFRNPTGKYVPASVHQTEVPVLQRRTYIIESITALHGGILWKLDLGVQQPPCRRSWCAVCRERECHRWNLRRLEGDSIWTGHNERVNFPFPNNCRLIYKIEKPWPLYSNQGLAKREWILGIGYAAMGRLGSPQLQAAAQSFHDAKAAPGVGDPCQDSPSRPSE
jgi:hypothetical protein